METSSFKRVCVERSAIAGIIHGLSISARDSAPCDAAAAHLLAQHLVGSTSRIHVVLVP